MPGFSLVIESLASLTNDQIRDRAFEAFQQFPIWLLRGGRTGARLLANTDVWLLTLERVAFDPSGVSALSQVLRYIASSRTTFTSTSFAQKSATEPPWSNASP